MPSARISSRLSSLNRSATKTRMRGRLLTRFGGSLRQLDAPITEFQPNRAPWAGFQVGCQRQAGESRELRGKLACLHGQDQGSGRVQAELSRIERLARAVGQLDRPRAVGLGECALDEIRRAFHMKI